VTRTVWGVIPCCGKSRRMGTPKPLLKTGNRTFLEHIISTLKSGGCERVLVCLPEKNGPVAAKTLEVGGYIIQNMDPEKGPISSLQTGIKNFNPEIDGALFCPVDFPLINVDTIRTLIDNFENTNASLTLPVYRNKRGHPVIFHRKLFGELSGDDLPEGARTIVLNNLSSAQLVKTEDEGVVIEIDDLTAYRRHFPNEYRHRFGAR